MPRKAPPVQLGPVPEIVDADWVQARWKISHRSLQKLIRTGVIVPYQPGGIKLNRFWTRDVLLALDGTRAVEGRVFLPIRQLNDDFLLEYDEVGADE